MTFINYRASAGSGKTYKLVLEYLNLALKYDEKFKHILAITFTNKAASEMKERILESLKKLSKGEDEILKRNLLERNSSLTGIEEKAGRVLKKILHNYSSFAVTTIDSFINRLVRSFSHETNIPPGFDVELNLNRMNNFVTKNIFSGIGKDPETTKIIMEFVFSKMNRNESWNVEKNITDLLKEMNKEKTETSVENIVNLDPGKILNITEELKKIFSSFMEKLIKTAQEGMALFQNNDLDIKDFSYGKNGAAGYMKKLSELSPFAIKQLKLPGKRFRSGEWSGKSSSDELKSKLEGEFGNQLNSVHQRILSMMDNKYPDALTAFFISENIFLLGLLGQIKKFLEEYKNEYNAVPIYDLTKNVHEIIKKGDIPFIYYILGDSFENIMIDEFQDTSKMQWDSLFPLIENSYSEGKLNLGVGDLKQSIYRWRGGDIDIMDKEILKLIPEEILNVEDLPDNYRSRENIVKFNNELFKGVEEYKISNELLGRLYKKADQKVKGKKGGFISLNFLSNDDLKTGVLEIAEETVNECVNAGFSLSDIAVLTRKKKSGMEIADHLISVGIDIITPELLLLHKNFLVIFLINLLRFTDDSKNKPVLAEILFFIARNFKDNIWDTEKSEKYFKDPESIRLPESVRLFIDKRSLLLRLPLYETIEELIRIFDIYKTLKPASSGYITSFLDMIIDYSKKEGGGLQGFFEWWETHDSDYSVPTPENKDGVNIMTIHKAKGLEFPVVIFPFSDWREKGGENIWLKPEGFDQNIDGYPPPYYVKGVKQLEYSRFAKEWDEEQKRSDVDSVNLFYVACTRARDALFLFSEDREIKEEKMENHRLLRLVTGSGIMKKNNEGLFTMGVLEKPDEEPEKSEIVSIDENKMISNRWSDKITIRERSEKFWDLTSEDHLKKIDRGIIIHEILSDINANTPLKLILDRMEHSGRIQRDDRGEIEQQMEDMFRIEEVKNWFFGEGEYLTEQPILTKDGVFRPDRVIISENSATIVDFKTGKESDSNLTQMEDYKRFVQEMGYEYVRGLILYIRTGKILEV